LSLNSSIFQAAIIFLHNAKGENQFVKEQGIRYLIKCSRVYLNDPFLKNTRVVKVLQRLVRNFDIPMTENQQTNSATSSPSIGSCRSREEPHHFEFAMPDHQQQQQTTSPNHVDNLYICNAITQSLKSYHQTDHLPILKDSKTSSIFTVMTGSLNGEAGDHSPARTSSPHTLNPFTTTTLSTRPEDMLSSTLTMGLGKNIQSSEVKQQQQEINKDSVFIDFNQDPTLCPMQSTQQQMVDLGPGCPTSNSTVHNRSSSANSFNNNTNNTNDGQTPNRYSNTSEADFNIHDSLQQQSYLADPMQQQQQQQFDFASLSSDVPVWDVPSGISWNEWDSFLKANVYSANN
jgi:hypothetical protein